LQTYWCVTKIIVTFVSVEEVVVMMMVVVMAHRKVSFVVVMVEVLAISMGINLYIARAIICTW